MALQYNSFKVPHTTRRKYGDYPQSATTVSRTTSAGGSGGGGGVGTTAYLTGWQTSSGDSIGAWTIPEFGNSAGLTSIPNGTTIKVKLNKDAASGGSYNTLDVGLPSEAVDVFGTGTTKYVFLESQVPLMVDSGQDDCKQVKSGDELTLTATVSPSSAGIKDIVWTSNDSSTAIVDENEFPASSVEENLME